MNTLAVSTSWESLLVFLGLILISAISNWLKQKRQSDHPDSPAHPELRPRPYPPRRAAAMPPVTAPPAPPKRTSWEEEMRRLLGGEPETIQPPALPSPPPTPRAAPEAREIGAPMPALQIPPRTPVEESPNLELITRKLELARMAESAQAYQIGQQVPEQIAERLQQVDSQIALPGHGRRGVSPERSRGLNIVRDQSSARQAFIATLVFGPPKALE
jgi:hypothetical protein